MKESMKRLALKYFQEIYNTKPAYEDLEHFAEEFANKYLRFMQARRDFKEEN